LIAKKTPQDLQNLIKYYFANTELLEKALTRRASLSDSQLPLDENMDPLATLGMQFLMLLSFNRSMSREKIKRGKLPSQKLVRPEEREHKLLQKIIFSRNMFTGAKVKIRIKSRLRDPKHSIRSLKH